MGYILWKTALIYLLIQRIRFVNGNTTSSTPLNSTTLQMTILVGISSSVYGDPTTTFPVQFSTTQTPILTATKTTETAGPSTSLINAVPNSSHSMTNVSSLVTNKATSYSIMPTKSSNFSITISSIRATSVVSSVITSISTTIKPTDGGDDDEPKLSLYIWEIVACAAGAFVCLLFIFIGILCFQNKKLRKKIRSLQSYSIPIKENGLWIDNQDIPLWQKRASTHNVTENAGSKESEAT